MTKQDLLTQAKVIGLLLSNGDITLKNALNALKRIDDSLDELESEDDYMVSLRDLESPEAFQYEGKE